MLKGYPAGSDISLLNVIYRRSEKKEDGKYSKDFIDILFKDNARNVKMSQTIYKPDYEYYRIKDDIKLDYGEDYNFLFNNGNRYSPLDHNLFFVDEKDTDLIRVPYTQLTKNIAENTGNINFYYDCINSGNRKSLGKLHELYNITNSDTNIEDHYRFRFSREYGSKIIPLDKSFFDIEVDTKVMKGDFPQLGECPINAVSYINQKNDTISVFLLRNPDNPLIEEFERSINQDLFNELKSFIIDTVGGTKKAEKYKLLNTEFEFYFFDEEINLIHSLFSKINTDQPDFLLAWNMAFDIPYIIERIKTLGYDPAEIICMDSLKEKYAIYYIDEKHKNEYEARGDYYHIAGNTVYLDQLIHFASRRKGQSKFPNFKLDTAGEILTGVKKLDYSHITNNITELPYKNYKIFIFYNIIDTVVQKCIEIETADIDYIYNKCIANNTRFEKGHRQTVYLTDRATKEFRKDNFIIGNNSNRNNTKTPFSGAIVGDPKHNDDNFKMKVLQEILNIANNLVDWDYKSLYPSIDREGNMAPNTQLGKLIIATQIYMKENPFNDEFYERGGRFLDDLCSGNYLEFCIRWFGAPQYKTLVHEVYNYFTKEERSLVYPDQNYKDGYIRPMTLDVTALEKPIHILKDDDYIKPMSLVHPPKDMKPLIKNIY